MGLKLGHLGIQGVQAGDVWTVRREQQSLHHKPIAFANGMHLVRKELLFSCTSSLAFAFCQHLYLKRCVVRCPPPNIFLTLHVTAQCKFMASHGASHLDHQYLLGAASPGRLSRRRIDACLIQSGAGLRVGAFVKHQPEHSASISNTRTDMSA